METALVKYTPSMVMMGGDPLKKALVETPILLDRTENDLLSQIFQYRRVGMLDKCAQVKRYLAGYRLKQAGLQLLVSHKSDGDLRLYRIDENGSSRLGTFTKKKMADSRLDVPMKFIEKLPDGAAKKLFVFERDKDPIAAYPVDEKNTYIALFEWGE